MLLRLLISNGYLYNVTYFHKAYHSSMPPWVIDRPQPALKRVLEEGYIKGKVLDVGCGTGDNTIMVANHHLEVIGLDFVNEAIEIARSKVKNSPLKISFVVANALNLKNLNLKVDTVIDSGLFHTLDDKERVIFLDNLSAVLKRGGTYIILCFSDKVAGYYGPRRISKKEIQELFKDEWEILEIRSEKMESTYSTVEAWLSIIRKA